MPPPGPGTQDILDETLSSQNSVRRQLHLGRRKSETASQSGARDPGMMSISSTSTSLESESERAANLPSDAHGQSVEEQGQELANHRDTSAGAQAESMERSLSPHTLEVRKARKDKVAVHRPETPAEHPRRVRTISVRPQAMSQTIQPSGEDLSESVGDALERNDFRLKQSFDYDKYLEDGLTVLAALAYRQGVQRRWTVVTQMNEEDWRAIAVPLLCSMHMHDLEQLIRGLPVDHDGVEDAWTENGTKEAPVIYARGFCNTRTGRSLTAAELRDVLRRLQLYVTRDLTDLAVDLVKAVDDCGVRNGDATKSRYIKEGRRQFFGKSWLDVEAHKRREIVTIFCRECERNLEAIADDEHVRTFYYIGYALSFAVRMEEHRSPGGQSSWFMNLFLACCKATLDEGDAWGFSEVPLCYCSSEAEVPVAEVLLTLLAKAWYSDGVGFGIHPPGLSVASSALSTRTTDAAKQLWQSCENFRKQHTPFSQNMEAELRRIQAYPMKHLQRVSVAASRTPDVQDEARQIHDAVIKEKNERRRKMRDQLARYGQDIEYAKRATQNPGLFAGMDVDYHRYKARLEALGPFDAGYVTDVEMTSSDEGSNMLRRRAEESFLPNGSSEMVRDVPLTSTEVEEPSSGPGPSNWRKRARG
jgi:hypothetical protein